MRRLSDPEFQASLVNKSIALVLVQSALLIMFAIHDVYVWTHPPAAKYFFIDGKHPPRPAKALDSPIVGDAELLEWVTRAILAPYNVNYHDYPEQMNKAGRRFTLNGWKSFAGSYISSGNFEAMKKAMLLCYAQAQRAAVIVDTKIQGDALSYRVQVPIVQTCQNTQQASTQHLMMTGVVVRTNEDDYPDGLAIEQLVAASH